MRKIILTIAVIITLSILTSNFVYSAPGLSNVGSLRVEHHASGHLFEREKISNKDNKKASCNTSYMEGVWLNSDDDTRGIIELWVELNKKGELFIRIFGSCLPDPCDWGLALARAYGKGVTSENARSFTAIYDHGFSEVIVTGELFSEIELILTTFTHFKDKSKRSDYTSVETFIKQ